MNTVFRITLVAIFALGAIFLIAFYARPSGDENGKDKNVANTLSVTSGILSADNDSHDFGSISMKNGKVSAIFKIKNTENTDVAINKMYTSCMCTEATLIIDGEKEGPFGMPGHGFIRNFDRKLKSGAEAEVNVVFDPTAHGPAGVGEIKRQIILEGQSGVLIKLNISANVIP